VARWTIINGGSGEADQIGKNGEFFDNLDLSFLPADVCAVQSPDGVICEIEKGDPATGERSHNEQNVSIDTLSWWSTATSTWHSSWEVANATKLASLSISPGTLSPAFSSETLAYEASVGSSVASVSVACTAMDSQSTITVVNADNLEVGENDVLISLEKEGSQDMYYVIKITREAL
jgi:hypothetical protein